MPGLTENALRANTRLFMGVGRVIGSPVGSLVTLLIGVVMVVVLAIGVSDVTFEDDLDNLWIEEGSRAEEDKKFFDDTFGGLDRVEQVLLTLDDRKDDPSSASDHGILTKEALYTLANITQRIFKETGELTLEKNYGGTTATYQWRDVCNRPDAPASMHTYTTAGQPYSDLSTIGAWLTAGATDSGQWNFYSQCVAAKAQAQWSSAPGLMEVAELAIFYGITATEVQQIYGGLAVSDAATFARVNELVASRPGLSPGFGLNRLACTRSTALDCFAEGGHDYPDDMTELSSYALAFATLPDSAGTLVNSEANRTADELWWSECRTELSASLTTLGVSASDITTLHTAFAAIGLRAAAGWGYWYRPSMAPLTDDEVAEYVFSGATNSIQQDATTCVTSGVLRLLAELQLSTLPVPLTTCCVLWSGTDVSPSLYLGGYTPEDVTTYADADNLFAVATRISFATSHEKSPSLRKRVQTERDLSAFTFDDLDDLLSSMEGKVKDYLEPMFKRESGSGFHSGEDHAVFFLDYLLDRSISDMLDDAANIESHLLIIGYLVLTAYACMNFVMLEPNVNGLVYSRGILCLLGVGTICLSTLCSFGFVGWVGMDLSPTNAMLVPFLSMGLGIDDLFVLLGCYVRHHVSQGDPEKRLVETMGDAGSSITVTSAANMVAFLIASIVPLRAVYTFSLQMATAVVLNWLCLFLLFAPLLFWDAVRTSKRRSVLCVEANEDETQARGEKMFDGEKFVEHYLAPLYANPVFKAVALVLFLGLTVGFAVVGFEKVEVGLKLSDVALEGTAIRSWVLKQEKYFTLLPANVVTRTIDYDGKDMKDFQTNLLTALEDLGDNTYVDSTNTPLALNWLPALIGFYQAAAAQPTATTVPESQFYYFLRLFLSGSGVLYAKDMACVEDGEVADCASADGANITIQGTKGTLYLNNLKSNKDYIDHIPSIRKTLDNSEGNKDDNGKVFDPKLIYAHGTTFLFWQQYVDIEDYLWMIVGFALLGVFVATFLFQFSPLSSLLVGVMLGATVLQLYGLMYLIDVKLNAFSLTNLAIAVGMAVEFTAHIAYAFLRADAPANLRDERVKLALSEMFPPMLSGAVTTFISVVCLAFAKYPFFSQYYFQMITLMIVMAFVNGMVFLPVILSIIGPAGISDMKRMSQDMSHHPKGGSDSPKAKELEDSGL